MPPYMREMPASLAAAVKLGKLRVPSPSRSWVRSVKTKLSPNMLVITAAAAPDSVECPLGYSGKGGVISSGSHLASISFLITVTGRT